MNALKMFVVMVVMLIANVNVIGDLVESGCSFEPISDEILGSKQHRALYSLPSKAWVESIGTLGRPASEVWAYLAFESAGTTASIFTGTLGAKVSKDALVKVAESYVDSSPKAVCKEIASSMMDVGLAAYQRNYKRYQTWKKTGKMPEADRIAFRTDNYTSNYLGHGKDLWADTMNYKYKQGKYSSNDTAKESLLKEIASVSDSASTAVELFDKLKKIVGKARVKSLEEYPPYRDHLDKIRAFGNGANGLRALLKKEEASLSGKYRGEVTLRDFDDSRETSAFSLKSGSIVSWEDMDRIFIGDIFFDMPFGLGTNSKGLGEAEFTGSAGIIDMGKVTLNKVFEAPENNYKPILEPDEIKEGHTFCVRAANGKNYAKVEILEFESGDKSSRHRNKKAFVKFAWEYQPKENVRKFDNVKSTKDPTKFPQYLQVKNASREEMKGITATLEKLPQAQFDVFDKEFLQLLWLKCEDNNVLIKVVKAGKLSKKELVDSAKNAAFYDWNLMVLKEEGVMSWKQVREIMNENTRKGLKRP